MFPKLVSCIVARDKYDDDTTHNILVAPAHDCHPALPPTVRRLIRRSSDRQHAVKHQTKRVDIAIPQSTLVRARQGLFLAVQRCNLFRLTRDAF